MTNELKEKILAWSCKVNVRGGENSAEYVSGESIDELLAIIDEGIEKIIPESMPFIVSENMEAISGWNACVEQFNRNNK